MEVFRHRHYERLVRRNLLRLVAPFARDLDGGFDGFSAGVHGQDPVVAEVLQESASAGRRGRGEGTLVTYSEKTGKTSLWKAREERVRR